MTMFVGEPDEPISDELPPIAGYLRAMDDVIRRVGGTGPAPMELDENGYAIVSPNDVPFTVIDKRVPWANDSADVEDYG